MIKTPFLYNIVKHIRRKIDGLKVLPMAVTLDISNRCNAACPFCARQVSECRRHDLMSKETFYNIMKQVSNCASVKSICLSSWGEAMLHPDFDEFVDYIKANNYNLGFPTNLSLSHKHFDSMMKADHIMCSIEGHDKESYEQLRINLKYETIYNNVAEFDKLVKQRREKGLHTPQREVNYLVNKNSEPQKFVKLWGDYFDVIGIRPFLPPLIWSVDEKRFIIYKNNALKEKLIHLSKKVHNMQCGQPFNNVIIRASGKLALCCSDYDSQLDFGDYEDLFENYKNNISLNKIREEFRKNKLNVCKNCFQNAEIPKQEMLNVLPELREIEKNNKNIVIYANR